MHNLREDHDFQAKFASLARKVEALESKKNDHVKSVQNISCYVCDSTDHSAGLSNLASFERKFVRTNKCR